MNSIAKDLHDMESTMRQIMAGRTMPYEGALHLWQVSTGHTDSPDLMHPFWLIWGSLTDLVEKKPEKKSEAEASIVRACHEWLALPVDWPDLRHKYMDRWVYTEVEYERKTEPAQSANTASRRGCC